MSIVQKHYDSVAVWITVQMPPMALLGEKAILVLRLLYPSFCKPDGKRFDWHCCKMILDTEPQLKLSQNYTKKAGKNNSQIIFLLNSIMV